MANLQSMSRHNERQNKDYGNKDIDITLSEKNYHLHTPREKSYEKEFERLRTENSLTGKLRLSGKKQSNVTCEFLVTSDAEYFRGIGEKETQRYFHSAYEFACETVGEKNIISAVVHLDETTPHMHLTYIPVVIENQKGQDIAKINCSKFWKGFNSYGRLQDDFYDYITARGFDLERGTKNESREEKQKNLTVEKFKLHSVRQEAIETSQIATEAQSEVEALKNQKNAIQGQIEALQREFTALSDEYAQFLQKPSMAQVLEQSKIRAAEKNELNSLRSFKDNVEAVWEHYPEVGQLMNSALNQFRERYQDYGIDR
jgi:archaellum component FlaC